MLACSSWYLRKPRQAFSLVSSYLNKTTTTTTSIVRDDPRFFSSASSSSSSFHLKRVAISPWLMLTPEIELSSGKDTVFKFYSLAENRVISTNPRNLITQLGLQSEIVVSLECWGSSHGWLVLFDRYSSGLFLYNPLSNRHLKLPSILKLDAFKKDYLEDWSLHAKKVIISSPDPDRDANCRVLMLHGFPGNLVFCCPNSSSNEWVETYHCYDDVARFPDGDNIFLGINDQKPGDGPHWPYPEFEGWDLKDVSRPTLISLEDRLVKDYGATFPWKGYGSKKQWMGRCANYLVSAPDDDGKNGSSVYYVCLNSGNWYLNKEWNYHFHVHKFDFESGKLVHMDGSLDGLAFFVGKNHSFALPAADFPELEPDWIYFTHLNCPVKDSLGWKHAKAYNYRDRTFSPPFYTLVENKGTEPPMWYTPTSAAAAAALFQS